MSGMMAGQPVPPKTSARDNEERSRQGLLVAALLLQNQSKLDC